MSEAGRVIAGRASGRRLLAPGEGTRPLADRVKQTLFAILEPDLRGAAMLDLFAGSGAAGIEALSRGASTAVFVERDARAIRAIGENLRSTGLAGPAAIVVQADVVAWFRRAGAAGVPPAARAPSAAAATSAAGAPSAAAEGDRGFDVVFVDPPYAETELLGAVLSILGGPEAPLSAHARVVAKHFWRDRPPERIGLLASERERRFGETALTFYRRVAEEVG